MNALDAAAAVAVISLFAIWLGYPLVIAALASVRRRPKLAVPALPRVTVVLATRGSGEEIAERVRDLLAAEYDTDHLDVVVAFDASGVAVDSSTLDACGPRVRGVLGDAPGGKAATLNAGVRAARGDVIVFADTHQRFRRDAIRRLAAAVSDGTYGAVSGRWEATEGGSARAAVALYWRLEARLRRDEALVQSTIGVTGAIYAMRRALWSPLPAGLLLDDVYAPMRLVLDGHRVGYITDAVATDTRAVATTGEFRRKVRTLTGNLQLVAWMPALLIPLRNPAWLQFIFHKLLRLLTPYLILVLGAWGVAHAGLAVVHSPKLVLALAGIVALALLVSGRRAVQAAWRAIVWGVVLQAATVVATAYGLRGRWNVWRT
jgi:cellulose synthase/poly-beta-1,6-N-acetylglucosamine synthase-like glycosyltransferase